MDEKIKEKLPVSQQSTTSDFCSSVNVKSLNSCSEIILILFLQKLFNTVDSNWFRIQNMYSIDFSINGLTTGG